MIKAIIAAALLFTVNNVSAHDSDGKLAFICHTKIGKIATIRQSSHMVAYKFGVKPDITVSIPTKSFRWQQFTGSGGFTNILYFPNGETIYEIHYVEMFKGKADQWGSIHVIQNDKEIAYIPCSQGSAKFYSDVLKAKMQY